jgi:phosphatidylinositol alpha-1,6-mannosyltransferase
MKILLVSTQDYLHHPIPSRHHHTFEELARGQEVHVSHFHLNLGAERKTWLVAHKAIRYTTGRPMVQDRRRES